MTAVVLRTAAGEAIPLPVERWLGSATVEEMRVLDRVAGPALDVGCGPGRHVLALAARGVVSLGIDVAPHAVRLARERGAPVLERSVFSRVPRAGRWGSVLLLDGNIGIGGDPLRLLRQVRRLLRPAGRVLVELGAAGSPFGREAVRLETGGRTGPWFPWARVPADRAGDLAAGSGLRPVEAWQEAGRWFARLDAGR